ncbi:unnamed protein product [Peniophora sp. CBMAI 1063]|nr:unnamed protein product [Peniophora sp. CBMAI 1063]
MQAASSSSPAPLRHEPSLQPTHHTDDHHYLRRYFIGPMPQHAITETHERSKTKGRHPWFRPSTPDSDSSSVDSDDESDGGVRDALSSYAFRYFLSRGGKEEEWGVETERSVRKEMVRRWKDSEWGQALRPRRGSKGATSGVTWVGESFEVGEFAGVNVLDTELPSVSEVRSRRSKASSAASVSIASSTTRKQTHRPSAVSQDTGDTFMTARSDFSTGTLDPVSQPAAESSSMAIRRTSSPEPISDFIPEVTIDEDSGAHSSNSGLLATSPILEPQYTTYARTDLNIPKSVPIPPETPRAQSDGILRTTHKTEAKKRLKVRIQTSPRQIAPSSPAPPAEVLNRTGDELPQTSAAAAQMSQAAGAPDVLRAPVESEEDGVIMRDRMLVRVSFAEDPSTADAFDEEANRTAQHLESREWDEFMVVWRKRQIELYANWHIPFRERMLGHKRLAYVIPLLDPKPKLMLYSFNDMSFSIATKAIGSKEGLRTSVPFYRTNDPCIFVFKHKIRTRAVDWVWHLWRSLGGQLPPYIEVRSPVMDIAMKVDVPSLDDERDVAVFSHDNLIKLCRQTLRSLPDWNFILESRLAEGAQLGLSWRHGTMLDWVWWSKDLEGKQREWAVLAGLALVQPGKPVHLEVRVGEHFPSYLHLEDGSRLLEPPPIEGYVSRVRPLSRQLQAVYLTVHNGLLFTILPSRASPPHPPGTIPFPIKEGEDTLSDALRAEEVVRGGHQISYARGVTDLRAVLMIRRASVLVPSAHEDVDVAAAELPAADEVLLAPLDRDEDDGADVGGEQGLSQRGGDRAHGRMRRCFELVMKNGKVIRFEAHSAKNAIEWIERLRVLVRYWRLRHLVDARQEMDVVHYATGKPRITPHIKQYNDDAPEPDTNPAMVLPYLSSLYNWCVYEGCRPVTKTGRIYMRPGIRGKYRLVQLFIVSGHLVQFNIRSQSAFHPRRNETISLLDAYAVSGLFAAQSLPSGQFKPNAPITARRYRDGLEAEEREEDTLFMLLYYPHSFGAGMGEGKAATPTLGANRRTMVFRARSKVERDLWCWAINLEIEKVGRAQKDRELGLRNDGGICTWKSDLKRQARREAEAAAAQ